MVHIFGESRETRLGEGKNGWIDGGRETAKESADEREGEKRR